MSTGSSKAQEGLDDLDVGDDSFPSRIGRSAEPEDLAPRGRGRKPGVRPSLEAGTEVRFWTAKGVCVQANVVRDVGGERVDLIYRRNGKLVAAEAVEHPGRLRHDG